jgi:proteic killer suppression protein
MYHGVNSRASRRILPEALITIARRKLDQLDNVSRLEDLRYPPGNRLEALTGNREGQYSIRINQQYRICFQWSTDGVEKVEITDYH